MLVKRIAVSGVLWAVAMTAVPTAQEVRSAPGPAELRANPITPENPVPRRTHSIAPAYPAEARAIDAVAVVTLRVTLDESGRIAELRRMSNPVVTSLGGVPANAVAAQAAGEAMVRSAGAALWQWQYDAPAKGPISFNVMFNFRPDREVESVQDSAPRPGVLAGVVGGRGVGVQAIPSADWAAAKGALRVGGNIRPPVRTRQVAPIYPPLAQSARVQGVVILEAVVGADGRVADARVLRSIPLLDQAALDAVRQWEYEPTLLNGAPVPVILTVTVQFTLPEPPPPPPAN